MKQPKIIMVAYDGSPPSKQALEWAICLAGGIGAEIKLVMVSERYKSSYMYETVGSLEAVELVKNLNENKKREEDMLEAIRKDVQSKNIKIQTALIEGNVADTLINFAKEQAADMIVVGSTGHGAFGSLLVGSVTNKLVGLSQIPVMVVKG